MLENTFPNTSKAMPEKGMKRKMIQFIDRVPMTCCGTFANLKNSPGPVEVAVN